MLIEKYKTIQAFEPKTTNAYVELKNINNAVAIVNLTQAVVHETDEKLLENNVSILANVLYKLKMVLSNVN